MSASRRAGANQRQREPAGGDPAYSWALLGVLVFSGVVGYCGISAMLIVSSLPASPMQSAMYYGLVLVGPAMLFVALLSAGTLAVNLLDNRPVAEAQNPRKQRAPARQPGFLARTMKPFARTPAKKNGRKRAHRKRLR